MSHLRVLVCRSSLLQLTTSGSTLHSRFPAPTSLTLRLLPPQRRDDAAGAGGAGPLDAGDGWHGSTAILSYFLSELGVATSVTSLTLQGWQELSPRDLHHVSSAYPRLTRLALSGLPGSNYLGGGALGALARGPAGAGLRELAVESQVVMDVQAAMDALSQLPSLASLDLSALPLLPSAPAPLPLGGCLGGLTRLQLTLEHRHPGVEAQLAELGQLIRLRHLGLDFMQLGTGSSLWSASWLLTSVLTALRDLTALHMPRAFIDAAAQPACLAALGRLGRLTDLALGSVILDGRSAERAAEALAAEAAEAAEAPPVGSDGAEEAPVKDSGHVSRNVRFEGDSTPGGGRAPPSRVPGKQAAESLLARPWRRLALGAAMPCYLEVLLPLMGVKDTGDGGSDDSRGNAASGDSVVKAASGLRTPVVWTTEGLGSLPPSVSTPLRELSLRSPAPPPTPQLQLPESPWTPGTQRGSGKDRECPEPGGGCAACRARSGSGQLGVLEVSSPCTLQLVQLLRRFVAKGGTRLVEGGNSHRSASAEALCQCGGRSGGVGGDEFGGSYCGCGAAGVRELSLLLRLAGNWREVVDGLAGLGPALRGLALLPTYLYASGTLMGAEVVTAVASGLPWLTHLELHRLDTDPRDVAVLGSMARLGYVFLGIAEEAIERRGAGHPAASVRALLAALHAARSGCTGAGGAAAGAGVTSNRGSVERAECSCSGADSVLAGQAGRLRQYGAGRAGMASGDAVVCCPELTEAEARRLEEVCDTEYGAYGAGGGRLRVEVGRERTLTSRLAVACGPGQGRMRF